ncbi:exodeoxyribonuclease VII small subunit [Kaarinaea lacus]
MPKKKSRSLDFEAAISELEQLVEQMEQGDISLEQSLKNFERGIELTRTCQKALQEAEQKVQILMQEQGEDLVKDFHTEATADNTEPHEDN